MSLGIQVNNLCQFLPQHRVSEFPRMTPKELLEKTQEAIGRDLNRQHKELCQRGRSEKELQTALQKLEEELENKTQEVAAIKPDYDRYNERASMQVTLRLAETKLAWCKYNAARDTHARLKLDLADLDAKKSEAKQQMKRHEGERASAQEEKDAAAAAKTVSQTALAQAKKALDRKAASEADNLTELQSLMDQLGSEAVGPRRRCARCKPRAHPRAPRARPPRSRSRLGRHGRRWKRSRRLCPRRRRPGKRAAPPTWTRRRGSRRSSGRRWRP